MSDIGYRLTVYSDIRYNVGLLSLQSDIKLSPISLITDIGVSAHLCVQGADPCGEVQLQREPGLEGGRGGDQAVHGGESPPGLGHRGGRQ
jgi:hypothetical protein